MHHKKHKRAHKHPHKIEIIAMRTIFIYYFFFEEKMGSGLQILLKEGVLHILRNESSEKKKHLKERIDLTKAWSYHF
jgi:hypothetical protein